MTPIERYLPPLSENAARWARFLGVLAGAALLLWMAVALSAVLTPIVAAFALAYILNPVVTWLERKRGIPRLTSITVGLALLALLGGVLLFAGTVQVIEFLGNLPAYLHGARQWLRDNVPALFAGAPVAAAGGDLVAASQATASNPASGGRLSSQITDLVQAHAVDVARATLASLIALFSNVFYWGSMAVLLPMYAFFFLLHFNSMLQIVRENLPERYRETIVRVVTTIDRSMANFFRGRLMICLLVGVLMAIGWTIVRVPSSILLGAVAGVFTLVPFLSVLALPPALVLAYAAAREENQPWLWPLMLVMAVYLTVQAIESFVLSPIVESRTSGLHPVTTVIALLIGNQVAGLLGMLLAIPLTSTLKSLAIEYAMPEVRRLAGAGRTTGPPDNGPQPAVAGSPPPQDATKNNAIAGVQTPLL